MSSQIPHDWKLNQLSDICDIVGGGTPERIKKEYWGGDIPWASPTEVTSLKSRYIYKTKESITSIGLVKSSAKLHPVGTLLMTSRASIGYVAIAKIAIATNQGFQSLRCSDKVNNEFLYQYITWIRPELEKLSAGSTFSEISSGNTKKVKVVTPPLPEQKKIAKILTSVDEVIEKTQAQIDKLKDLKTSMMQELLTNGIGHAEFKDSSVGRIPADWKRVKLGAVSTLITKGSTPTTSGHAYVNSGVRFFRSINASEDGTLRLNDIRFISEEASRAIRRSSLEQGDIVISIVGAKTGRTYFCIENNVHLPANINQNIALIRPSNEVLSSAFLKFVISAQDFQHQVDLEVTTQAQPSLSLKQVGEFEFNLPPITEQVMIAEKLNSLVSGIKLIQDKLQQTKLLKKALMQDLLTGKVRVKVS